MALITHMSILKVTSNLNKFYSFIKGTAPVIPINDLPADFPNKEEAVLRCKLAGLYRLIDRYGHTYGIYNHISVSMLPW